MSEALKKHYVAVKTDTTGETAVLQLPFTIGNGPQNDIVVNLAPLGNVAYEVSVFNDEICVNHIANNVTCPTKELNRLGLRLAKPQPIASRWDWHKIKAKAVEEFLAQRLLQFLPEKIQTWVQLPARTVLYMASIAFLIFLMVPAPTPQVTDLSRMENRIEFDVLTNLVVGASPSRKGYENGFTLSFTTPSSLQNSNLVLNFEAGQLDIGKELTINLNNQPIHSTKVDSACISSFCPFSIKLPAAMLTESGLNHLFFQHNSPESAYLARKFHISATHPMTDLEQEQVSRWILVAQRALQDSEVVPENLVLARGELQKTLKFLGTRSNVAEQKAKVEAMLIDVQETFAEVTTNFWSKVEVNQKLKNWASAERFLQQLQRMYPDSNSQEHQTIRKRIEQIREMKK